MVGSGKNTAARIATPGNDIVGAILQFATARPLWLQDALRRLAMEGPLGDQAKGEVLAGLKAQHDLAPPPPLAPISRDHLRAFGGPEVRLLAIADPSGVNRLASGQVLSFAEQGITIVYGDNGSGKTSFFRILVGVCGGRAGRVRRGQERAQSVLRDVYVTSPSQEPPQATLKLSKAGEVLDLTWRPNAPGLEVMRGVHLFDQFAVPKYVDEDCALEFVPFGLQVFDDLVELCRALEGLIQGELDGLRQENDRLRPVLESSTPSARFVAGLSHETTAEELQRHTTWTAADEAELAHLETALGDARNLVRLAIARQSLGAVHERLCVLERATSDEASLRLSSLRRALGDAEVLARRLAEQTATDAPLGGVGSEPWRALLRAARRFSEELAYPGEPFPKTDQDSRCVLCQQDLDEAARQRLRRFEVIAADEAQRSVNEARRQLDEALAQLPATAPPLRADLEAGLAASSAWLSWPGEAALLDEVERFQRSAEGRAASLRAGVPLDALPASSPSPTTGLAAIVADVAQAHAAADAALQGRTVAEARRADLRARKLLAGSIDSLRAIVLNQVTISRLETCQRELSTRQITIEATKLKTRFIGSAFQEALESELRALDLTDFAVRIAAHGERGVMVTRLRLAAAATPALPGDVLSRGEQQVLAIACFLAELRATGSTGAVVFDDPVSSLDQDRRRVVARRLAKLAAERQVIVLTHDIALVYLTLDHAQLGRTPCELRSLEKRRPLGAGLVSEGLPFRIRKVESRINQLKSQDLPRLRTAYESGDADYACSATGIWTRLRGMWEGAIEEHLFNGTVRRFQHDVKPSSLIKVPIPRELRDLVLGAWARLSPEVHDEAPELSRPLPTPDDVEREFEVLKEFIRRIPLAVTASDPAVEPQQLLPQARAAGRRNFEGAQSPGPTRAAADATGESATSPFAEVPSRNAADASPSIPGDRSSVPGDNSEAPRPLRLFGLGRDSGGRMVRREWDEAAVLRVVEASRALDQARRDLSPITLEQFLQRRNRSGVLPCVCLIEGRRVSFFHSQDDLETHLERLSRRDSNGTNEPQVRTPGDPEGLELALAALQEVGLDLSDLGVPGEQRSAADGDLFAGASARWALELDGRQVPVFVLGDLRQLVERPEVMSRVSRP